MQKGDSLTGNSLLLSISRYHYSGVIVLKDISDDVNNEVVYGDDQLLEEKTGRTGIGSLVAKTSC